MLLDLFFSEATEKGTVEILTLFLILLIIMVNLMVFLLPMMKLYYQLHLIVILQQIYF